MMGFRPNMRTTNDVFVSQTLTDKQFYKGEKLYCCFVDFSKAFDIIWRKGLLSKLKPFSIEGKMFIIIRYLFSDTNGHVTVDNLISENFEIKLGVKQGYPLSPFFVNMYRDELCSTLLQSSTDIPLVNDIKVPCLFR